MVAVQNLEGRYFNLYFHEKKEGMYLVSATPPIHSEDVILSQIPVYYSDHQLLCVAVSFKVVM